MTPLQADVTPCRIDIGVAAGDVDSSQGTIVIRCDKAEVATVRDVEIFKKGTKDKWEQPG